MINNVILGQLPLLTVIANPSKPAIVCRRNHLKCSPISSLVGLCWFIRVIDNNSQMLHGAGIFTYIFPKFTPNNGPGINIYSSTMVVTPVGTTLSITAHGGACGRPIVALLQQLSRFRGILPTSRRRRHQPVGRVRGADRCGIESRQMFGID